MALPPPTIQLILASILIAAGPVRVGWAYFDQAHNVLGCQPEDMFTRTQLGDDCRQLKVFNQLELDQMDMEEVNELARSCACQLSSLPWEEEFDSHQSTRQVARMVEGVLDMDIYRTVYPKYLWSDIDIVVDGVSIWSSVHDYFERQANNPTEELLKMDEELKHDQVMVRVRLVCLKIAVDRLKLYRYLENLHRISPVVFLRLLETNDIIEATYQASKACKKLVNFRGSDNKARPEDEKFVVVEGENVSLREQQQQNLYQTITYDDDLDRALVQKSALLMRCNSWQVEEYSLDKLTAMCPMIMGNELPTNWIKSHSSPLDRSETAINCGCQLLKHNSSWAQLIQDPNVRLLDKALTSYFNTHRFPHLDDTPLEFIYDWFMTTMERFAKNRKLTFKEVFKQLVNDQDPMEPAGFGSAENQTRPDETEAIERTRRACNFIMFNQNKANPSRKLDIELIKYLDNLKFVSRDPLFVFHLTLQDANLFKLHALSKMCEPIVR